MLSCKRAQVSDLRMLNTNNRKSVPLYMEMSHSPSDRNHYKDSQAIARFVGRTLCQ